MNTFWLVWPLFQCLLLIQSTYCYPEQGKWTYIMTGFIGQNEEQSIVVTKSLYKGSKITVKVICQPNSNYSEVFSLNITWYLKKAACWKEYYETSEPVNYSPKHVFDALEVAVKNVNETSYYVTSSELHECDDKQYYLSPSNKKMNTKSDIKAAKIQQASKVLIKGEKGLNSLVEQPSGDDTTSLLHRKKREMVPQFDKQSGRINPTILSKAGAESGEVLFEVEADGIYQFILGSRIQGDPGFTSNNLSYTSNIYIEIYGDYGYLSAADYPLLIFYSSMCVIYVVYGVGWLVVSFMRWRELLRVQYWIGAVILLGMLEKAVFTAEYESVNERGTSVPGLIVFAEVVSCAKRTIARMLVIIVSFGFGIVKPRLGVVLHRVVGVGLLYFVLASIEGCMRALRPKIPNDDYSKRLLFAIIPLALLESAICWWVFSALVSTTRTLRLRRNTIKLNLFRHFTNTLVFAVVTSIIFMLWSIKYQNYDTCVSDWKELWVNDAFWHVLFALILLVIMVLWRPTNNNQRFAFSPLLDEGSEGEEEEQEKLMANVSDTMKLRVTGRGAASSNSSREEARSVEDDLKWLEENIPSSMTDTGLPMMDSDEEILTTKFEISKMQ